jgi:hypothetical protein
VVKSAQERQAEKAKRTAERIKSIVTVVDIDDMDQKGGEGAGAGGFGVGGDEDYGNVPCIRLVSRLNGAHKLNWQVPKQQTISVVSYGVQFCSAYVLSLIFFVQWQLKVRIANTYGLADTTGINIVFDGERLENTETVDSLGLEDDYMIEIQVGLYIACIVASAICDVVLVILRFQRTCRHKL